MAERLSNEFSDGEVLEAADLNDTFDAVIPVGSIIAWHKDKTGVPSLPPGWVECNGQTLNNPDSPLDGQTIPDLNGGQDFLRANSTSGGTGGRRNNDFTFEGQGDPDAGDETLANRIEINGRTEFPQAGDFASFTVPNEPPYFDVVMIMRVG